MRTENIRMRLPAWALKVAVEDLHKRLDRP